MNVSLPVSPLSRKILLSKYGPSPIRFSSDDPILAILSGVACQRQSTARADGVMLVFDLPPELVFMLAERPAAVKKSLHKFLLGQMLEQARLAKFLHLDASRALRAFYAMHGIDDDDYAHETAFRMYQRHRSQAENESFLNKKREKEGISVLRFSRPSVPPPSEDRLRKTAARIVEELSRTRPDLPDYTMKQIEAWLWLRWGQRHAAEVARKIRRHPARVYAAAKRIEGFLEVDVVFSELFRRHLPENVLTLRIKGQALSPHEL